MTFEYTQRSLEPILKKAAEEFPAVVLTGPRFILLTLVSYLISQD